MTSSNSRQRSIMPLGLGAISFLLVAAVLVSPNAALADITRSASDIQFAVFVPCAADGAGEVVLLSATLSLVTDDGVVIHGNLSPGDGVGLTTGDRYIAAGSPSNLNPAGDGDYLYHLAWIGVDGGAKFNITATGPIMAPPTTILQVSCHG